MPEYRPTYQQSWAIVVGINAYTKLTPLQYAVNDARLMAATLCDTCGFSTENLLLLEDKAATHDEILNTFRRTFSNPSTRRVGIDDRVVFFFAGHGLTRTKKDGTKSGWLALANAGADDWDKCLGIDELLDEADYVPAKHILLLFDACFSGLALTRSAGIERMATDLLTRPALQVLTAGKADQVVSDGSGWNSPFTLFVVDGLKGKAARSDGLLTARGLSQYVYERVGAARRSIQTPDFGNVRGDGDMVLAFPKPPELPEEIHALLTSSSPRVRASAVDELAVLLSGKDPDLVELAQAALVRLRDDAMPSVRTAAREVLGNLADLEEGRGAEAETEAKRRAQVEAARLAALRAEEGKKQEEAKRAEAVRRANEEAEAKRKRLVVKKAREELLGSITSRKGIFTVRRIAIVSALAVIAIVLGVTRLGFIPVPNVSGNATIMHVPAIIGGVLEGPVVGLLVGGIFGIYIWLQDTTGLFKNPMVSVVPRLFIGVTAYYSYVWLKKTNEYLALVVAGVVGTLTNTILVVGALVGFALIPAAVVPSIIPQAIAEVVIAAVITVAVVAAWKRIEGGRGKSSV